MRPNYVRFFIVAGVAGLVLAVAAASPARSQIDVAPSYQPIGTAASGNSSTVWLHEPSSRRIVACQTVGAGSKALAEIQCVSTRLP
ncbi:hypothetical protein [Azoarcus olearius]|uniref:Hypothetical secreted protein n=1 Tax=Azoarcus sp. (strain BH72) TaxID=418699 RepID=A1K8W2_AZOSB|nr:hypothetical protein [Azoarcus olearius]CAL95267.1 hypothetical secreted protein [Azoarcus olearius]